MLCLLCCGTGLQASPSKHAGYSVRMENAVPIVTQAPGAQPLQIQPGLLAQVRNSKGTELSMCLLCCLALGGWAFSEDLLWWSSETWATVYGSAAFSEMSKSPPAHCSAQRLCQSCKSHWKNPFLSAFLLKLVGKAQGKQCLASAEKPTSSWTQNLGGNLQPGVTLVNCMLLINALHALSFHHFVLWAPLLLGGSDVERDVGGRGKGPTLKELSLSAVLIVTMLWNVLMGKAWFPKKSQKTKKQTGMGITDYMHIFKGYPSSSNQRSSSFLLVIASVNLNLNLFWTGMVPLLIPDMKKKPPRILKTKLCKLEKMTN